MPTEKTAISWTNATWSPTRGCTRVSDGCGTAKRGGCYAERLAARWMGPGQAYEGLVRMTSDGPRWTGKIRLVPEVLDFPKKLKPGSRCFVNSMSDLFHAEIPNEYLSRVFTVMNECSHVTFQILTKRPQRAAAWEGPWTENIWIGTSVENRKVLHRLDDLRPCRAPVRFISFEPLLEDLGPLNLDGYHWGIVGGESGKGYRPMSHAWARAIRDQCVAQGVAFFFKQSSHYRTEQGVFLEEADGSLWEWHQYPGQLTPPEKIYDPTA